MLRLAFEFGEVYHTTVFISFGVLYLLEPKRDIFTVTQDVIYEYTLLRSRNAVEKGKKGAGKGKKGAEKCTVKTIIDLSGEKAQVVVSSRHVEQKRCARRSGALRGTY